MVKWIIKRLIANRFFENLALINKWTLASYQLAQLNVIVFEGID